MFVRKWNISLKDHTAVLTIASTDPNVFVPTGQGTSTGVSASSDGYKVGEIAVQTATLLGTIASSEYGTETIQDFSFQDGKFKGTASLRGTSADITASISANGGLNGVAHIGWFINLDFFGSPIT